MAISKVADRGSAGDQVSSTTLLVDMAAAGSIAVGSYLIVRIAADNSGTGGAGATVVVTDPRGNTWVTGPTNTANPANINSGSTCTIAYCKVTNAFTNGDDITITFSPAVIAKAAVVEEWAGIDATTPVAVAGTTTTGGSANLGNGISRTPTAVGQLMYTAGSAEGQTADAYTEDGDTTDGSWVSLTRLASGSSGTSSQKIAGAYKLVTGTTAQAWTATITNRDWAAGAIVFAVQSAVAHSLSAVTDSVFSLSSQLTLAASLTTVTDSLFSLSSEGLSVAQLHSLVAVTDSVFSLSSPAGLSILEPAIACVSEGYALGVYGGFFCTLSGEFCYKSGSQYVDLPGTPGNYISTPDSVANSITSDIDLRAKIAPNTWSGGGGVGQMIISKHDGGVPVTSYQFYLSTTGALVLGLSADGTTNSASTSTVVTGFSSGSINWVRVTWNNTTDVVQFFTSDDGVNWTQLGLNGVITLTGIFNSTVPVNVGARSATPWLGESDLFSGSIYYIEIRNGVNGPIVASFNADSAVITGPQTPNTVVGATGETWAINGAEWVWGETTEICSDLETNQFELTPLSNVQDVCVVWCTQN